MAKKKTRRRKLPLAMNEVGERDAPPELQGLPTGEKIHLVPSGPTVMSCMYHPERLYEEAAGWILNYLEALKAGETIVFTGRGVRADREAVREAVRHGDPELREAFGKYADLAARYFAGAVERKLHELPQQLFIEVMIATVTRMKEDGFVPSAGGAEATEAWNDYLDSLRVSIKSQWEAPRRGKKADWSPEQRAEVLDHYNATLDKLQWAKDLYESEPRPADWEARVKGKYPELDDALLERLIVETPSELAYRLTGVHFGVVGEVDLEGEDYLKKQLTQARSERGIKRRGRGRRGAGTGES